MDARRIPLDVQQQAALGGGFSGRPVDVARPAGHVINGHPVMGRFDGTTNGHTSRADARGNVLTVPELVVARTPDLAVEPYTRTPERTRLGAHEVRFDIRSSMGPFHTLPEYKTNYSPTVVDALGSMYRKYNAAFGPIVEANREWDTDYQYAMVGPGGSPVSFFVQVDMVGLPTPFLDQAARSNPAAVEDAIRNGTFEIDNSLAMYQLLGKLFPRDGQPSRFQETLRAGLDEIRERTGKPIALLAVTEEKAAAMRTTEFGKEPGEPLTDEEVFQMTGFDKFFGPKEFAEHVRENGGDSAYVLYARTSEPVAKLRKPNTTVSSPLLEDPDMRRVIKANAITFNVDDPTWGPEDPRTINDTKKYMAELGLAYAATVPEAVFTTQNLKGGRSTTTVSDELAEFLVARGVDPLDVDSNTVRLRAKPLNASYGCYGHASGTLDDKDFRGGVRKGMKERGPYVIQPEITTPTLVDEGTGETYVFIDRNFMTLDAKGKPVFMGGFRSLIPTDHEEAKSGRIHGNGATRWAEVRPAA